ncbi:MAG TPA: pitrilysin family protein [Chloroflexota bacterium]|nr:pitrilysin family protein [Chloroflexota bacterium]
MANHDHSVTFPNGLLLLSREDHTAPVATFWVWYRVGGRNEAPGRTGISHWVEHMLFKGTPTLGKGEIFRSVTKNGGTLNGFTWVDYTTYFETLPSDRLDLAIRIESDRMVNSLFDPDEVSSERTVILSERSGSENSPTFHLGEEVRAAAFKVHPYGNGVIGWKSDLETMTREDLYDHYRHFYTPGNAVAVCVGDFEQQWLVDKVGELFGSIPAGPPPPEVRSVEPPQEAERRIIMRRPAPNRYFQSVWHAPAASDPTAIPAILLDSILSGAKSMGLGSGRSPMGRSSRLYRSLVHRGLASSAGSSFSLTRDPYLFGMSATLQRGVELATVEQIMFAEIDDIRSNGVSEEEVERAKKQVRAQFIYGSEGVTSQAYWLGNLEMVASHTLFETLLDRIGAVTPADVQQVAETYLGDNRRTVGWLEPVSPGSGGDVQVAAYHPADPSGRFFLTGGRAADSGGSRSADSGGSEMTPIERSPSAPSSSLEIKRHVTSDETVILGWEHRTTPAVVIRAMLKAGAMFDPPEKLGLGRFTGAMLQRGTEKWSFEKLTDLTDSLGLSISVDVGRHATEVLVRCLTEDLQLGVDLLAEVLRRPTFPADEMEKVRGEVLTHLREADNDTRSVAERVFRELAYPADHPYSRRVMGDEDTIRALEPADLVAFHRQYYRPDTLIVAVAGDIEFADVVHRIGDSLSGWIRTGVAPSIEVADVSGPGTIERRETHLPGKTQSDIVLGLPALRRRHPDYYALEMANMVLGRLGLMGRLGDNVRDRRGLAYYAYSDLDAGIGPGPWAARAGVSPANVGQAIEAILDEIKRMRENLVEESELADAQSYLTGVLPLALETSDGVARTMLSIEMYELGLDYIDRYPGIIRSLTREQVLEAAQRYFDAERYALSIAGPA